MTLTIKGVPSQIVGVCIKNNNQDTFERDIKNYLQSIKPRMPYFRIRFIYMSDNKYVIIIYIKHDHYAPYIHLVDQKDYRIYKRIGNSKAVIEYQELKNMFTQSLSLEKEIEHLREERISYFSSQEDDAEYTYSKFFLMHIIPDTFMDINYNYPLFVLEHRGAHFSTMFSRFGCASRSIPTPEGLRYIGDGTKIEGRFWNNGVAEFFYPLGKTLHIGLKGNDDNGALPYDYMWQLIKNSVEDYIRISKQYMNNHRFFVCISIIGCKDAISEKKFELVWESKIERNNLVCNPSSFMLDEARLTNDKDMERLHLEFLTSIGVKYDPIINVLITDIYGVNQP